MLYTSVSSTSPNVLVSYTKDDLCFKLKLQGSWTDLCDTNGASCLWELPQCSSFMMVLLNVSPVCPPLVRRREKRREKPARCLGEWGCGESSPTGARPKPSDALWKPINIRPEWLLQRKELWFKQASCWIKEAVSLLFWLQPFSASMVIIIALAQRTRRLRRRRRPPTSRPWSLSQALLAPQVAWSVSDMSTLTSVRGM